MSFPFPYYDYSLNKINPGYSIGICKYCEKKYSTNSECKEYYKKLLGEPLGKYQQCPSGFTTCLLNMSGKHYAITGIIACPRFGTYLEREVAKKCPNNKVSRNSIETIKEFISHIDSLRASEIQSAAKFLPQAFHELRKLNGAIIQHAEKELKSVSSPSLLSIKGAAELMRNNFDILEALSNIDGIRALPMKETINLHGLLYKTIQIFETRAQTKKIKINFSGVRAIIYGSQKSFPIIPAVLIENAIKYGNTGSNIYLYIKAESNKALIEITNETQFTIDPDHCFEKGTRYAENAAEGGGFGLFLAKEIVLAHNGMISCMKNGSFVTMKVEFPLKEICQ